MTALTEPFELPVELAIDTDVARRVIGEFIRGQLRQAGFERAVLALSGGIDSALVAYLVGRGHRGGEPAYAVLMPYRSSSPASRADAETVVAALGCSSDVVEITAMVDGYFGGDSAGGAAGDEGRDASSLRRGNFAARMRMAVMYDRSVTFGGLVVGTGNKTESLIGYTTLYGDSACAFNPIGDLYKSQVRQLAVAIGVPDAIVRKAPSADLWPGQTDEGEGEFSYPTLDRLLFWRIDKRRSVDEVVALGFDAADGRAGRSDGRRCRVQAPGPTGRKARPAHGRRRLSLPATPTRLETGVTPLADADRAPRPPPADADGAPRGVLYVVATPIGNLGDVTLRALEILRSVPVDRGGRHAPHAPPPRSATRSPRGRPAITPAADPSRLVALLDHLRGGADLALVTDAGTPAISDPGGELVAGWAAEGGTVVPLPGASAVLAAVAASGVAGPRWSFEGFLPRTGRERRDRIARIAADDRAHGPVRGTRASGRDARRACAGLWEARPAAVCRELTKLHETIERGSLGELAARAARGEIPAAR